MLSGIQNYKFKQEILLLGCSLVLAHFFIALGRDDALWGLFFESTYYVDLIFVTPIVFLVCQIILVIWKRLDIQYPWQLDFKRRLAYQVVAGIFMPTALSFLLVYAYMSWILQQDITATTYFYYELPVSVVIILMINLVLGLQRSLQQQQSKTPPPQQRSFVVQSGIAQVLLDPEQVVLVEKDESLCFVYTSDKKRYVFSGSLDLLSQQLPSQRFFRTNRQTITHRSNCHSFTSERSGKLVLVLHYPSAKTITISQKKAREFKQWLSISHGLKSS